MRKKSFSWGLIALMLYLFFPIGIWMIIKKMTDEKYNYTKNGKALRILAWILIGIVIFYLTIGLTTGFVVEDGESAVGGVIVMILIFGGGGVLSLIKANSYIKKGTKYARYVSIVSSVSNTSIDSIAAAYPTTYEKAVTDIQQMLDDGYFMNAYIDLNRRALIMPQINATANIIGNDNATFTASRPTSVKCKNCGAENTVIPGSVNECEYCGSPLQS